MITFEKITEENFGEHTLDGFCRHQEVCKCWTKEETGEWHLVPRRFTKDWNDDKLREMERDTLEICSHGFGFLARDGKQAVGFALVDAAPLGEHGEYLQLTDFQVSEPYRNRGIGKELFRLAAQEAKAAGAEKLYISTHCSKETHAAYHAIGCVHATWLYAQKVEEEPDEVQMEYVLA